jgi:hypothetical protein
MVVDEREFQKKLQEFGELVAIESSDAGAKRTKPNQSLPQKYKCLNDRTEVCDDCGKIAVNRRVAIQLVDQGYCRMSCSHCKMCRDPNTGRFDITAREFLDKARYYKRNRGEE